MRHADPERDFAVEGRERRVAPQPPCSPNRGGGAYRGS